RLRGALLRRGWRGDCFGSGSGGSIEAPYVALPLRGQVFGDLPYGRVIEEEDRRDVQLIFLVDRVRIRGQADRVEAEIEQDLVRRDVAGIELQELHDHSGQVLLQP